MSDPTMEEQYGPRYQGNEYLGNGGRAFWERTFPMAVVILFNDFEGSYEGHGHALARLPGDKFQAAEYSHRSCNDAVESLSKGPIEDDPEKALRFLSDYQREDFAKGHKRSYRPENDKPGNDVAASEPPGEERRDD